MSRDKEIIWKVVVIHHPIFSAGEHHGDHSGLNKMILPILEEHKVDLILSGHEHNVQYLQTDLNVKRSSPSYKKEFGVGCTDEIDHNHCSTGEYFHYELGQCGIQEPTPGVLQHLEAGSRTGTQNFFGNYDIEYKREFVTKQHQYMHHFVLGNGGIHRSKICPTAHAKSQGDLRYGNTVHGMGDVKIREDKIEVELMSADNKRLYSVKIRRDKYRR